MNWANLDRFSARLAAAATFDAGLDLLADEVRLLGLDGFDYASLPARDVLDGTWAGAQIFERNFPAGWQAGWRLRGRHDPILPAAFRKGLPVDWQDVRRHALLTGPQRESFAYLEEIGFRDGITIPIHEPANRFAFVSGVSYLSGKQWDALRVRAAVPLTILAHTFHHVMAARNGRRKRISTAHLTRREIQCLQLAAIGNRAPATAQQLNRSVDTVRRHLKNAMAKLGANTITQSVAIGVARGLITVDGPTRPPSDLHI